ncbi:MAG TPA: hypothetical protein PLX18_11460 [Anaerohalosphaeraceae bacterium]|nr:hypothetical protein [Anaerohalosphaeraceae bacterium]HQG06848.1 hypothetical protein [Anaerohalosphaeraceae bacterium]HQI08459.1 hypothetical protein [Anaerohalosphaeraceae bacterium]HQJ68778.1 hypothetical protein [Anaerohalosphaeraceae bacterium]
MRATAQTEECTKVMILLSRAAGPMTAIQIAERLGLGGSHETKRRQVRAIIKQLREEGEWIVSTNWDGYWLTEDAAVWRKFLEQEKIEAKQLIGEVQRRQKMITDRFGQGYLFSPGGKSTGIG